MTDLETRAGAGGAVPLIAVDEVTVLSTTEIVARKLVRADDPYLVGHYPGDPIYPGVFSLETVRQAVSRVSGKDLRVRRVVELKLLRAIRPGAVVIATIGMTEQRYGTAATALLTVAGSPVARLVVELGEHGECAEHHSSTVDSPGPIAHHGLKAMLPHRYPMLLVDRVDGCVPGSRIETTKAISGSEPCYASVGEAAPGTAYRYPDALLLESFVQSCGVLWAASASGDRSGALVLAEVRGARFGEFASPGDVVRHTIALSAASASVAVLSGRSTIGRTALTVDRLVLANARKEKT